tara:strand:+ start:140 stop:544 length:405 start_codon:yes stop_codon:yes gene_type:complete
MFDPEIVKYLVSWINNNTDFNGALFNFDIIQLKAEEIQMMACRGKCPILAFFLPEKGIFVSDLDFNHLCNKSILLHEIIHALQYVNGENLQDVFKEKEAYQIQNKFLIEESSNGESLQQLNLKKCRSIQSNVLN